MNDMLPYKFEPEGILQDVEIEESTRRTGNAESDTLCDLGVSVNPETGF